MHLRFGFLGTKTFSLQPNLIEPTPYGYECCSRSILSLKTSLRAYSNIVLSLPVLPFLFDN